MDRDWMAIGITLNLSNSSFPPLPPTPPLPFRAPLRPKTSLKEPAIPLPQTRSSHFPYHYNTSFLRSFFLHILSFSPKTPHGRTQTRPHHAGSSASQTMPQPTPNRNPCHALHSLVSLPTGPWLSSPPLRCSLFAAGGPCKLLNLLVSPSQKSFTFAASDLLNGSTRTKPDEMSSLCSGELET